MTIVPSEAPSDSRFSNNFSQERLSNAPEMSRKIAIVCLSYADLDPCQDSRDVMASDVDRPLVNPNCLSLREGSNLPCNLAHMTRSKALAITGSRLIGLNDFGLSLSESLFLRIGITSAHFHGDGNVPVYKHSFTNCK